MKVIVLRHGIALDRDETAHLDMADVDRPLTPKGRRRVQQVGRGLVSQVPDLTAIVSSPLVRAVETAEIVVRAYGKLAFEQTRALSPEADLDELCSFLAENGAASPVAVVGHEPHLSLWASYCLTGQRRPILELRKGGACMLQFEDAPKPGTGRLSWLVPPSFLRRLGRR